MYRYFHSPNILATGTSGIGEQSYSVSGWTVHMYTHTCTHTYTHVHTHTHTHTSPLQHHIDQSIGVPVIDRWTYYALEFLEKVTPQSRATMGEFVSCGLK